MRIFILGGFLGVCIVGLSACKEPAKVATKPLSSHTLIYGGDIFLGRGLNRALHDPAKRNDIFGTLGPLFRQADVALVNAEGVIGSGGTAFNKGEPRPFLFRAHPSILESFQKVGIDVVTIGNNHGCDYGASALWEMQDRLLMAGMDYTGGGRNKRDSHTPSYHRIGDTVIGIVGADLTINRACNARESNPGVLFLEPAQEHLPQTVNVLTQILTEARQYAHLVFFTPHWGENNQIAPTPQSRELAKRLIEAGYDGILGHSAHRMQGVELISGKPVIYDAGNLLADLGGRAMAWQLHFNRQGVTHLEGFPLQMSTNQTNLAVGPAKEAITKIIAQRCESFGVKVETTDKGVRIPCVTGKGHKPSNREYIPRQVPQKVRLAPSDILRDQLPGDVTKANVEFENGVTLVGYKLVGDALYVPKASQFVELYFTASKKIDQNFMIELAARKKDGSKAWNRDRHIPGDWLLPAKKWPVGKIVADRKLFRLKFAPEGTVEFFFSLVSDKTMRPSKSDLEVDDTSRIRLGETPYTKDAPRIFDYLYRLEDRLLPLLEDYIVQ